MVGDERAMRNEGRRISDCPLNNYRNALTDFVPGQIVWRGRRKREKKPKMEAASTGGSDKKGDWEKIAKRIFVTTVNERVNAVGPACGIECGRGLQVGTRRRKLEKVAVEAIVRTEIAPPAKDAMIVMGNSGKEGLEEKDSLIPRTETSNIER